MKKTLFATIALAAGGMACAQSSVTLFGVVDATLAHGKGSTASITRLANSGNSSSRLGFRGTEDLGGGMSASFWLEAGVNNDDGQGAATNSNNQPAGAGAAVAVRQGLTFNRRSTVSLAGGWGEVRLGRDYTPQFWNLAIYDPFGVVGVGINQAYTSSSALTGVTAARASNSIGYFLPRLGGVYGQLQAYLGENLSNAGATRKDGNGQGIRLGYASGPLDIAISLSRTNYASGTVHQNNIGGQWDFGAVKLMANIARDSAGTTDGRGWLIGAIAPVGAGEVKFSLSQYLTDLAAGSDPRTRKIALGYVHNLSKRTAMYVTYARVKNSGGAALALNAATTGPNQSSSGYDIGLRHSF